MMSRVQLSMMVFGGTMSYTAHVWVGGFPYINVHNLLCLCDSISVFFKTVVNLNSFSLLMSGVQLSLCKHEHLARGMRTKEG